MVHEQSARHFQKSKQYLASGVSSTLRLSMKPMPVFAAGGSGATVTDMDGNRYIDYLLAYGPLILGHAHPGLTAAVCEAAAKGATYGLQHQGEMELAQRLTEALPCADKVALSGSGTEAVMLALRLARAYTGKTKIIRFEGHYHGWADTIFTSFPSPDMQQSASGLQGRNTAGASSAAAGSSAKPGTSGQSAAALADIIVLPWNDVAALEETLRRHHGEIAAVISEPVMCNSGCIAPHPGYLQRMRELTAELGVVMILDEVITGFRLGLGGAHGRFGLLPDLVTVGKALGGGFAVSAVGGKDAIMELIADGTVNHLGTLNGNGVATAAGIATIRELAEGEGAAFVRMERLTERLVRGIRERLAACGMQGVVNQLGPVFHMMFTAESVVESFAAFGNRDAERYARFAELMLEEGVMLRPTGLWYVSAAHEEADIEATLQAMDRALARLAPTIGGVR
ncbi:glutamate-1-semialdehyde 2,1-aminomutase [Paenibacillus sp. IB182496]|uniref:glutamate-1-semialdehyde 2,1-aminomutase n=1 Tax=Paenibacillus sabuli TaxID=2772509 RepID=A0A927BYW2_9BACL|nr:glutamate-1-semialdehyde 2,1-aminomutase [Paenibacillus sabuli]MBD2848285.1 glutamate-1-semialdehyde 2,1-aminomutase [Paenibacillus sabuli]